MINVLIVEDDPMVAEFNKRYLQKIEGFQLVDVAPTVKQALEVIKSKEIDLILLDIYMPGKNGLDLLTQIIKLQKGIDVIVISAASDIQSVKKALRYGAVDYLIKPFEFERFQASLTAYREEVEFMEKQEKLSQDELDRHLFYKDGTKPQTTELPKGLTKSTLNRVWGEIKEFNDSTFSADELANKVGISRVSMQKYTSFLTSIGVLTSELNYGSVGRPIAKYRCNDLESYMIQNYL